MGYNSVKQWSYENREVIVEDIYNIRKGLIDLVKSLDDNENDENNEKYIHMQQCDITGSLGVWGIAH